VFELEDDVILQYETTLDTDEEMLKGLNGNMEQFKDSAANNLIA